MIYKVLLTDGDSFNVIDLTNENIKNLNEVASVKNVEICTLTNSSSA